MSDIEAIRPYTNPEYWDGHAIGDGDAGPHIEHAPLRDMVRGAKVLRSRLEQSKVVYPLETYRTGDAFSADSYNPGTIVLFRQELLLGNPAAAIDAGVDTDGVLQDRPFDVTPFVEPRESSVYLGSGDFRYYSTARWGVITAQRRGPNQVPSIPVGEVVRLPSGRVDMYPRMLSPGTIPPVTGVTEHGSFRNGIEELRRVNLLQVIAYGQTVRARRIIQFGGKLATE